MQNFGKIKNAFNNLLIEGIVTKTDTNKKVFSKYIQTLKENKILKTQFLVYTNIENKIESDKDKATQFVKENIKLFSQFSNRSISDANTILCKDVTSINNEYDLQSLHENIAKLIFIKKTPNNIDERMESIDYIVNHIISNKPKEINESIELPNSMLSSMMIDKYNIKYSELDESNKRLVKVLISSTDEEKKEIYSLTIRECIDIINERLNDSDLETKDKLLRVKDKLLNDKQSIDEDFTKNISKLVELKNTLINTTDNGDRD